MDKDKVITWVMVAALCGSVIKMAKTLMNHGTKDDVVEEIDDIDE